jgi:protocatechuate 3,4-dioxygenase beta subunit
MQVQDADRKRRVQEEIQALPEALRMPVVLHYQAGCTYEEVATTLRIPSGTVATRIASAKERLRTRLATAGLLVAAGASLDLEEALGTTAPEEVPSPALQASLEAMLQSPPATGWVLPRSLWYAAAAGLLVAVMGTALILRERDPELVPPPAALRTKVSEDRLASTRQTESADVQAAPPSAPVSAPHPENPEAALAPQDASTGTLFGCVTCPDTGLPVEGAEVQLGMCDREGEEKNMIVLFSDARVRTDASGRYRLEGIAPGKLCYLYVHAPAYCEGRVAAGHILPDAEVRRLDPEQSKAFWVMRPSGDPLAPLGQGEARCVDATLRLSLSVTVTLKTADGEGLIEKVRVAVLDEKGRGPSGETSSGTITFSNFLYTCLPSALTVEASAPGFLPVRGVRLPPQPDVDGRFRVEVPLSRGQSIEGVVLGPDGRPAKAHLVCWASDKGLKQAAYEYGAQLSETDAEGAFRISGLPPGEPISVWAWVDEPAAAMAAPVRVPASGACPLLWLEADDKVSGRLLDAGGKPVAGAQVCARIGVLGMLLGMQVERRVATDAEGRFTLQALPGPDALSAAGLEQRDVHLWFKTEGEKEFLPYELVGSPLAPEILLRLPKPR